MNKTVALLSLAALAAACDVAPETPSGTTEPGPLASHEQLLIQALAELPVAGEPALVALRAQLQAQLDRLRSSPVNAPAAIEQESQPLFAGNGCSGPWWADLLLGLVFKHPTSVFDSSCNWHDQCYASGLGTYGLARSQCDSTWKSKGVARCDDLYPPLLRALSPSLIIVHAECKATVGAMYTAISAKGSRYYEGLVCLGGQKWPTNQDRSPGCSSYEPFDSGLARVCSSVGNGLLANGTVGRNWLGCRGTGCAACAEKLADFPSYFKNHPLCSRNTTCGGTNYGECGAACPAPSNADRQIPFVCKQRGESCRPPTTTEPNPCCTGMTCKLAPGAISRTCLP